MIRYTIGRRMEAGMLVLGSILLSPFLLIFVPVYLLGWAYEALFGTGEGA